MKEGWKLKKLGEVLTLNYGKALDQSDRSIDGKFPVFGANGSIAKTNKFLCENDSIIIGRKGSAGELNYINVPFWALDVTYYVTIDESQYNLRFMYHLLTSLQLQKLAVGVKPGINRENVYNLDVKIPTLSEQHRIVTILDNAFEALVQAKQETENNLLRAKELFQSELNRIFEEKGEEWEKKLLKEVCTIDRKQGLNKNLPYVGMEDIESEHGIFIGSLDNKEVKSSTFIFTNEHILFGRLRPYLKKILCPDFEGHCSTEIIPIKTSKIIDKNYLFYWFLTTNISQKINDTCTGCRMPRANIDLIFEFRLSIPPLSEQLNIVIYLKQLSETAKALIKEYSSKLLFINELKQSLLHQAFNGNL
jgi:type I restriction enzyme S subunit